MTDVSRVSFQLRKVVDKIFSAIEDVRNSSTTNRLDAEEKLCIHTRSAFATFVGDVSWAGKPNPDAAEMLKRALHEAEQIAEDEKIAAAISKRVSDFERLSRQHADGAEFLSD